MIEDLNALWDDLESDSSERKKGLLLRKLRPVGMHIGIDLLADQKVLILEIQSSDKIKIRTLPKWKGVNLDIARLHQNQEVLLLRLIDEKNTDIFNSLIRELEGSLNGITDLEKSLIVFIECLERWKAFFEKHGAKILSAEALRGLFGELFFLKNHVFHNTDILLALNYWRGHDRKHHDFSFPSGNVEVKTTIKKDHKSVIVNSEKQLDHTGLNSLYLYCLAMNMTENKQKTLNKIIEDIIEYISEVPNAVSIFRKFLNQAGYIDEHKNHYDDIGLSIKKEYFFNIREGFPRIVTLPIKVSET